MSKIKQIAQGILQSFITLLTKRLLEFLGAVIAVVALIISLSEIKKVDDILKHISTRPKKNFPENSQEIHDLIDNAKDSLTVIIDQPMYGGYSKPKLFFDFFEQIRTKLNTKGFLFKIVFPKRAIRDEMRRRQFNITTDTVLLESIPAFKDYKRKLQEFCDLANEHSEFKSEVRKEDTVGIKTYKDFENFFEANTEAFIRFIGATGNPTLKSIDSVPSIINVNYWLADGKRMFFSLISYGRKTEEYSFYSEDIGFTDYARDSYTNLIINNGDSSSSK